MTAHDFRVANAALALQPQEAASHPLDELDVATLSSRFVVFTPTGEQINALVERARKDIPGLAGPEVVQRIVSHNPDTLWAIARREKFDAAMPRAEGFVAFLMLNEAGMEQLIAGQFNGSSPDVNLIARQNEKPAGIYGWAIHARGFLAGAIPLTVEKISTPLYRNVDLYTRAATPAGERMFAALGFTRGATYAGRTNPKLMMCRRFGTRPEELPLYDRHRTGQANAGISVTVARSFEDLMRVVSLRSAVYVAEQSCPYEEEFDGNDLSATHLIGYVGDEPAGCLRLRYFANFAKVERLAVRREFRSSRAAFHLVRAGIELCRKKGYERLYGHARKDLVKFWSRFGFRTFEGGRDLVFSDHAYVEMVLEAARDPEAISIGIDPYVIIRPEGRWHEPGVLESSVRRCRPEYPAVSGERTGT